MLNTTNKQFKATSKHNKHKTKRKTKTNEKQNETKVGRAQVSVVWQCPVFTLEIDAIRNGDVHLVEHQRGHLLDLHPILDNVIQRRVRRGDREAYDILALQRGRHAVLVAAIVEALEQPFGDLVLAAYAKDDQAQMPLGRQLEAMIGQHQSLEFLRQTHAFPDVALQTLDAKRAQHKPHFERPKAPTQWYLPVHEVDSDAGVLVLQIQRLHVERAMHCGAIAHPHRRRIEVHHQPLGGIEGNRVHALDAAQPGAKLRADERAARISRIHVQPQIVLAAHDANLRTKIPKFTTQVKLDSIWMDLFLYRPHPDCQSCSCLWCPA